jgi:ABC-type transport system substrate-binding protein
MLPKEAESGYDIRNEMIGTGAYYMADYQRSVGFTMKKFPEYWDAGNYYIDQVDLPIISEYATVLGQFKAGNIFNFGARDGDILAVKREEPRLLIFPTDVGTNTAVVSYGWQPPEGATQSPFIDERVRQASSMSWDRDLWNDTRNNISAFAAEGLPVDSRWNSAVPATWNGWWLDPKGKDFGPNAKYYQYDIAEAKKLLAAAGFPNGLDIKSRYVSGAQLNHATDAEILDGMNAEAGFRITPDPIDYNRDYIPVYRDGQGQYDGWAYHTVSGHAPLRVSPVSGLAAEYWSKAGVTFKGFSTTGKNDKAGDPQVDSMVERARLEFDVEKRRTLVNDLQKYLAQKMYSRMWPGGAAGFTMAWPTIRNFRVWRGGTGMWGKWKVWIDPTLPPFA